MIVHIEYVKRCCKALHLHMMSVGRTNYSSIYRFNALGYVIHVNNKLRIVCYYLCPRVSECGVSGEMSLPETALEVSLVESCILPFCLAFLIMSQMHH